jgi:hypothetical protein
MTTGNRHGSLLKAVDSEQRPHIEKVWACLPLGMALSEKQIDSQRIAAQQIEELWKFWQ